MFNKLYDNCFKTELQTEVIKVKEDKGMYWHAFKDTIFYVEGGGMESDIGMIDRHMVHGLKKEDGYVWHLLDEKLEGSVFMSVNLHERFRKCQIHTAQHLISAVLQNVYNVKTLSHHVSDEVNDVELSFDNFNEKMAIELQVLCNGLIRDDLAVSILYPTHAEANEYLTDKEIMRSDLRVVRIGVLDYTMCGCMHVPFLRYLQMLFIEGFEKTKNGYKIRYLVGDQLLDCIRRRYRVLDEASVTLAVSHLYLNTGVSRLLSENKQLRKHADEWKDKYISSLARELGNSKEEVLVRTFEDLDSKGMHRLAQMICDKYHKAVVFLTRDYDNAHIVIAKHEQSNFDVKHVFDHFVSEYHIKGSCKGNTAQGGGLYREEMETYMKTLIL